MHATKFLRTTYARWFINANFSIFHSLPSRQSSANEQESNLHFFLSTGRDLHPAWRYQRSAATYQIGIMDLDLSLFIGAVGVELFIRLLFVPTSRNPRSLTISSVYLFRHRAVLKSELFSNLAAVHAPMRDLCRDVVIAA